MNNAKRIKEDSKYKITLYYHCEGNPVDDLDKRLDLSHRNGALGYCIDEVKDLDTDNIIYKQDYGHDWYEVFIDTGEETQTINNFDTLEKARIYVRKLFPLIKTGITLHIDKWTNKDNPKKIKEIE